MEVKKPYGAKCAFSGGNENTPTVQVVRHRPPPLSLQDEEKVLWITQGNNRIQLSRDTLAAILAWADKE